MSRIANGPGGSGVSHFDSAINEPKRTELRDLNLLYSEKNDGVDEGASDDDLFDDDADLTQ